LIITRLSLSRFNSCERCAADSVLGDAFHQWNLRHSAVFEADE